MQRGAEVYERAVSDETPTSEGVKQRVIDALRVEVLVHATQWEDAIADYPPLKFLRMGPDVDSPAVPRALAENQPGWGSDKLYGSTLGHFGAFVKGDWRVRDYTWGRLDAAAHLVRLIAKEGLASIEAEEWQRDIQEAILREHGADLQEWHNWVRRVFADGGITNKRVLDELHKDEHGHSILTELVDEALSTIARSGRGKPGRVKKATSTLLEAMYLEEPLPDGYDRSFGDLAVGALPRHLLEEWIKSED